MNEHWNAPIVQEHWHRAQAFGRFALVGMADHMIVRAADGKEQIESPIEALFVIWWNYYTRATDLFGCGALRLRPQKEVMVGGRIYRLDFAIEPTDPVLEYVADTFGIEPMRLAVELDGHEFHERTREQVAHRNERDRVLQEHGWTVLHYSGSEINRDPESAVTAAARVACGHLGEFNSRAIKPVIAWLKSQEQPNAR